MEGNTKENQLHFIKSTDKRRRRKVMDHTPDNFYNQSATIKDLCPNDKARIRKLVEDLARLGTEKDEIEKKRKKEKEDLEDKMIALRKKQSLLLKEKATLEENLKDTRKCLQTVHHSPNEVTLPFSNSTVPSLQCPDSPTQWTIPYLVTSNTPMLSNNPPMLSSVPTMLSSVPPMLPSVPPMDIPPMLPSVRLPPVSTTNYSHTISSVPTMLSSVPPMSLNNPPMLPSVPPMLPSVPPMLPNVPPMLPNVPPMLPSNPPMSTVPPMLSSVPPTCMCNVPPMLSSNPTMSPSNPTMLSNVSPLLSNVPPMLLSNPPMSTVPPKSPMLPSVPPMLSSVLPMLPSVPTMLPSVPPMSNVTTWSNQPPLPDPLSHSSASSTPLSFTPLHSTNTWCTLLPDQLDTPNLHVRQSSQSDCRIQKDASIQTSDSFIVQQDKEEELLQMEREGTDQYKEEVTSNNFPKAVVKRKVKSISAPQVTSVPLKRSQNEESTVSEEEVLSVLLNSKTLTTSLMLMTCDDLSPSPSLEPNLSLSNTVHHEEDHNSSTCSDDSNIIEELFFI